LKSEDPFLESFSSAVVQPDGKFPVLNVQPGSYSLDVSGIPQDFYIKTERSDSLNLAASPLGILWDAPALLQIIIGIDGGSMSGSVVDASSRAFAGAQVVLVPNVERRGRPDQKHTFDALHDGLPQGLKGKALIVAPGDEPDGLLNCR